MTKKNSLAAAGRTALSVFFALSVILASSTSPVSALDYEECAKDWLTGSLVETVYDYIMGNPNYCLEITDGDYTKTSRTDQEAKWKSWKADTDSMLTQKDNHLQDTRAVAMTKAKIAIVNSLNAGENRTQAKAAGKEAINDYYSMMEYNLLQQYNQAVIQANYTRQVEMGETDSDGSWIRVNNGVDGGPFGIRILMDDDQVSLINGTTVTTHVVMRGEGENDYIAGYHHDTNYSVTNQLVEFSGNETFSLWGTEGVDYNSRFSEMDSQASNARSNVDTYVDGIYDQYAAGEIDAADIAESDPTVLYQEASTDKESTGYYGYSAVQLAALGYAGNTNASHSVTVNGSTTYEGTLFYTDDDLDQLQTGSTYNTSDYSGLFMMAVQNGSESEIRELKGDITIDEATNVATGESVENTTIERKVYETTNASELETELEALRELREEYEAQATYAGSGGGDGIDVGFDLGGTEAIAIIAVVGGALFLAGRRD